MKRQLLYASLLALTACYAGQESACGSGPTLIPVVAATPKPSPSPSVSPTGTPDPCNPVVGVNVSGPFVVKIGSVIRFDVTPVTPNGPLEGALDYCNAGRIVIPDSISANLRCVGSCSTFGPNYLAQGVGPFSVRFRVLGAVSAPFEGTVTQ